MAGIRVVSLAVNLPGPLTAARYVELGAHVAKVVPPGGDPLAWVSPEWHDSLKEDQEVLTLDLKSEAGQTHLAQLLVQADVLLTATRPAALARLGLDWPTLSTSYPQLCQVAIVGYAPPDENRAGHDLTYQASAGLLEPPEFPRIPLADYAGSERAVSATLALLWERSRTGKGEQAVVSMVEALRPYAHALCYGLLAPGTLLGGASPLYGLYRTRDGWLALASLEPHFRERIRTGLGIENLTSAALGSAFATRTSAEWDQWAKEIDVPLAAVREPVCPREGGQAIGK
jgi:crotonobetainyl-CoA:carnitine CoA-transferase CaiB-like acyl-CoA transferase